MKDNPRMVAYTQGRWPQVSFLFKKKITKTIERKDMKRRYKNLKSLTKAL